MKRSEIKLVLSEKKIQDEVLVKGWVRSVRKNKGFSFIVLNDGSSMDNLQLVADENLTNYDQVVAMLTGTSVEVRGKLVESGGKNQSVEMQVSKLDIIGTVDETYPLQKKGHSLEFLREIAHLRPRSNAFMAVFRIRHTLSMATHEFFNERGFHYVHTPILSAADAEGAGELFQVTTLDHERLLKADGNKVKKVDYQYDFFGKPVNLCVTGQLEAEALAMGLGKVYTFGPTFRAENSNTPRHLAEFWMIEPEVAFADLDEVAELSRDYVQYMLKKVLEENRKELEFLKMLHKKKDHIEVLEHVRDSDFKKITYTEAMDILSNSQKKFEYSTDWGEELQTEHERFLAEEHFKCPVIVTDYPASFKAFYMKQNSDGKTVRAMDVLVPGIGELIGGSQREENLDKLLERMGQDKMDEKELWWYLELRRFGTVPHGGFGLGFERMVMYATGMTNIRDVIPFPRHPKHCEF